MLTNRERSFVALRMTPNLIIIEVILNGVKNLNLVCLLRLTCEQPARILTVALLRRTGVKALKRTHRP